MTDDFDDYDPDEFESTASADNIQVRRQVEKVCFVVSGLGSHAFFCLQIGVRKGGGYGEYECGGPNEAV